MGKSNNIVPKPVLAVGLFAMPSTLTLFAGQHTFNDGANVSCAKCHQDIINEASSQTGNFVHYTIMNSTSNSGRAQCRVCHTTGNLLNVPIGKNTSTGGFNYSSPSNKSKDIALDPNAHASVSVECVSCHSQVPSEILGANESHGPFYNASAAQSGTNGTNMFRGANEACIGCHTHIWVNITWNRAVGYNMVVNETGTGQYVLNFTTNATTNTTYSAGNQ